MTHSDDKGLVLPPNIAPIKVVIVPIWKTEEEQKSVDAEARKIYDDLKAAGISVKYDEREHLTPGHKFNEWEKKGVPVRVEIGPKDIANKQVVVARRDIEGKINVGMNEASSKVQELLKEIQENLFNTAAKFRKENTYTADTYEEFKDIIENKGGFVLAHWDGTKETEAQIAEETKATIRVIPFDSKEEEGKDMISGKPSKKRALFARAY
jgi:prolyl-tRNA synthetase